MKIQKYNPIDMSLEEDSVVSLDFGTIYQGNHCETVQVVRPVTTTESSLSEMKLFLENNAPYTKSSFGVAASADPISGITPGSDFLSDHFSVVKNPALSDGGGVPLQDGEYVWLDIQLGDQEKGSYNGLKYRFVFDYV